MVTLYKCFWQWYPVNCDYSIESYQSRQRPKRIVLKCDATVECGKQPWHIRIKKLSVCTTYYLPKDQYIPLWERQRESQGETTICFSPSANLIQNVWHLRSPVGSHGLHSGGINNTNKGNSYNNHFTLDICATLCKGSTHTIITMF